MTRSSFLLLFSIGGDILALVGAAFLLLIRGAEDGEIAARIGGLHKAALAEQPRRAARFWPVLVSMIAHLGTALHDRVLSAHDAEALARSLAASGFEPSKAMPTFVGAKVACLFLIPPVVYLVTVLLGYPTTEQLGAVVSAVTVAMMLPKWVMALVRRPYQKALRRGIPDALDLLVVCAEAGLGLDSALERVAQEMKKSNRPVGVEFALFSHELRIMPDRSIALANLAERTGQPALRRLASTIAQTMKYGTPLSQGLRSLAAEMRVERMVQFEEQAARLPALLTLPMLLFILPCLFIVLMGEPVSQLMGALSSMH